MKIISDKHTITLLFAIFALLLTGLACGSSTPAPPQYVGAWTGSDGASITIRADGSGDYKAGSSSVSNGSVTVDEGAKTLKITLAGMGPTYQIDKPPAGNEMTLSGVVFRKSGSTAVAQTNTNSSAPADSPKAEIPSNEKLQTLTKTTFLDFGDAVQSEDFSDFHKKIAKVWRDDSTPDELNEAFKVFIANKADYNFKKAIAPMDAEFTPVPAIEKVADLDALVLRGNYPTKPERTNFELKYAMEDGTWKLIGINIKTRKE